MLNLSRNKFQCIKLKTFVTKRTTWFYFVQHVLQQLATLKFVARQVVHAFGYTGNKSFNLQCDNVAQQVESLKALAIIILTTV